MKFSQETNDLPPYPSRESFLILANDRSKLIYPLWEDCESNL